MTDSAPPLDTMICFRVPRQTRALLEQYAGDASVSDYMRLLLEALFEGKPRPRARRQQAAAADQETIARVLAQLGKSRLANNLNQLAHLAHVGALPINPETEAEIREAAAAVRAMRADLLIALGLKVGGSP